MPLGSPKLVRREQAIEAARRRLRRLEIEAHRIKADLARLEAEYEDDVADHLSRKLRRRASEPAQAASEILQRVDVPRGTDGAILAFDLTPSSTQSQVRPFSQSAAPKKVASKPSTNPVDVPVFSPTAKSDFDQPPSVKKPKPTTKAIRKSAPPLVVSLALHAAALLFCLSVTIVTIVQQETPLLASPTELDETAVEEFSEIEIEPTKFEDEELQNVIATDNTEFNVTDNMLREFDPSRIGVGTQPLGEIGQLDALPSDLGTLMTGAGSPGSGAPGGDVGNAIFFGARSKGDRFVFVVDNSSSMKGGRLESATAELVRTIEQFTPKQSFYVIFVSDQTYPMFYPTPATGLVQATPENKKKLAEWLPNAMLASGKNRELIKAMDLAATMQPHAVFLLWDGDLKYSDKVRMDVMMHLTRPGQWSFAIHTLGMGVTSTDSEQNLAAIAQAHNGTYRRVNVPMLPTR